MPAPGETLAPDARATGVRHTAFATAWFTGTATRRTLGPADGSALVRLRACREGAEIGTLYADTADQVIVLLRAVPNDVGDGPLLIDVPGNAPALSKLLTADVFAPVFETARMYLPPTVAEKPRFYAGATQDLG